MNTRVSKLTLEVDDRSQRIGETVLAAPLMPRTLADRRFSSPGPAAISTSCRKKKKTIAADHDLLVALTEPTNQALSIEQTGPCAERRVSRQPLLKLLQRLMGRLRFEKRSESAIGPSERALYRIGG